MSGMKYLNDLGYKVIESDNPDREPIDFSLSDGEDSVAWVWGKTPDDLEWECDHPEVEYGDDDEQGRCVLCGAMCDWHYEASADDGYIVRSRVPHEWYKPKQPEEALKEYIGETYESKSNTD